MHRVLFLSVSIQVRMSMILGIRVCCFRESDKGVEVGNRELYLILDDRVSLFLRSEIKIHIENVFLLMSYVRAINRQNWYRSTHSVLIWIVFSVFSLNRRLGGQTRDTRTELFNLHKWNDSESISVLKLLAVAIRSFMIALQRDARLDTKLA
jgi:hypothetical protein